MNTFFENIKQGLHRILKAFVYSYDGFKAILKSEPAFRQELVLVAVLAPLSLRFDVSTASHAIMIFSLFFILFAEMVNTAIEVVIDRISPDVHPLSKKAKDIGSLMVLLAFINVFVIWAVILL